MTKVSWQKLLAAAFVTSLLGIFAIVGKVHAAAITVTYPNGGESFNVGDSLTIRWQQQGIESIVSLYYSTGPGNQNQLEASGFDQSRVVVNGSEGSYTWTIPKYVANQGASNQIKIQVVGYPGGNQPYVQGESNGFFTVTDPSQVNPAADVLVQPVNVQVVGSTYTFGGHYDVQWSSGCRAEKADVWLVAATDASGTEVLVPLSNFVFTHLVGDEVVHEYLVGISPSESSISNSGSYQVTLPTDARWYYNELNQPAYTSIHESITFGRRLNGTMMVKESLLDLERVKLPSGNSYGIRVNLYGGCTATGVSQPFIISNAAIPPVVNQAQPPVPTTPPAVMCPTNAGSESMSRAQSLAKACERFNLGTMSAASCTDGGAKYCFTYQSSGLACVVDNVSGRVEVRLGCNASTLEVAARWLTLAYPLCLPPRLTSSS